MNKKRFFAVALLLSTAQAASPASPAPRAPSLPAGQSNPIILGAAFNLTGALSSLDAPASRGAALAVREVNSLGGVLGRPLKLVTVDTATDLSKVPAAAKTLIQAGASALLGYTDTDPVLAFSPLSEAAGLPFVVVGGTAPRLGSVGQRTFLEPFADNT